jgi:hypothetical protein
MVGKRLNKLTIYRKTVQAVHLVNTIPVELEAVRAVHAVSTIPVALKKFGQFMLSAQYLVH